MIRNLGSTFPSTLTFSPQDRPEGGHRRLAAITRHIFPSTLTLSPQDHLAIPQATSSPLDHIRTMSEQEFNELSSKEMVDFAVFYLRRENISNVDDKICLYLQQVTKNLVSNKNYEIKELKRLLCAAKDFTRDFRRNDPLKNIAENIRSKLEFFINGYENIEREDEYYATCCLIDFFKKPSKEQSLVDRSLAELAVKKLTSDSVKNSHLLSNIIKTTEKTRMSIFSTSLIKTIEDAASDSIQQTAIALPKQQAQTAPIVVAQVNSWESMSLKELADKEEAAKTKKQIDRKAQISRAKKDRVAADVVKLEQPKKNKLNKHKFKIVTPPTEEDQETQINSLKENVMLWWDWNPTEKDQEQTQKTHKNILQKKTKTIHINDLNDLKTHLQYPENLNHLNNLKVKQAEIKAHLQYPENLGLLRKFFWTLCSGITWNNKKNELLNEEKVISLEILSKLSTLKLKKIKYNAKNNEDEFCKIHKDKDFVVRKIWVEKVLNQRKNKAQ